MNAGYNRHDVTVGFQAAIARTAENHRAFTTDKTRIGQLLRAIELMKAIYRQKRH